MSRLSLRAYARHRGCALYAVQKAIKAGRISKGEDGLIDSEVADAAWAANTDRAKAPIAAAGPAAPPADGPLLTGEVITVPAGARPADWPQWEEWPGWKPSDERPSAGDGPGRLIPPDAFMAARTRLANAEAQIRELALAEKLGQAISGEEARRIYREIGKIVAGARKAVANELAPKLVGVTDPNEIERRITAALVATDERIANEIAAKYTDYVERSGTGS